MTATEDHHDLLAGRHVIGARRREERQADDLPKQVDVGFRERNQHAQTRTERLPGSDLERDAQSPGVRVLHAGDDVAETAIGHLPDDDALFEG